MTEPTDPLEGLIDPTEPEDHSPLEKPGNKIGPYRLLQVLGSGGFGEVWLAERREPFIQRVALKVVKPGMDTKAVLSRFEQERQVLAQMSHPNIAKVLDAGVNEQGRPYFVMEYVPGKPITEFADEHKLSIQARLEYFLQVCNAIAHAHQKGVIHRDIKPGNILVSRGEIGEVGTGSSITNGSSAKVIDFGVAKAMAVGITEQTVFTQIGQGVGTWGYMSPEQIEGDTQTPSDVYSLGVLLYELMCGEKPYDISSMRNFSPKERADFIRGVEVVPPSKRLLDSIPQQKSRSISAVGQVNVLRELDWVCLKALSPDIKGRYLSVHSLAEDVQRFISGEQVEAAPISVGFQVQRFWRRHSVPVIATIIATLSLTLGGSFVGKKVVEYKSLVQELSEVEEQNAKALTSLAVKQKELDASESERLEGELSLIWTKRTHMAMHSGAKGDPVSISTTKQAWASIFGKGFTRSTEIDGRSFEIRAYSESGLWALVQLPSGSSPSGTPETEVALVKLHDGVPQVVSGVPKSMISEGDRKLLVTENESGSVSIVSFSLGKIFIAHYSPESGPIEPESIKILTSENFDLDLVWYAYGAVLVADSFRAGELAILDLQRLDFSKPFDPKIDLIYLETTLRPFIFRSDSGYVLVELDNSGGDLQRLNILDVNSQSRDTRETPPATTASVFNLPVDDYGKVVELRPSPKSNQIFLKSRPRDWEPSLFVLDVQKANARVPSTTFQLAHSIEANEKYYFELEAFLSTTGVYVEVDGDPDATGYVWTPSFTISDKSIRPSGLDYVVLSRSQTQLAGVSNGHLLFTRSGRDGDAFLSIPRPQSVPARAWYPSSSNDSIPAPSRHSGSFLRSWPIGDTSDTPVRQGIELSSDSPESDLQADHSLPHYESICEYFIYEGKQFVITECHPESTVRVYQSSSSGLELKTEFCPDSLLFPPRVTFDPESELIYVLEQSAGDDPHENPLDLMSLFAFSPSDPGQMLRRMDLKTELFDSDTINSIIFDNGLNKFWCFTSSAIYYFSLEDFTLRPFSRIRADSWRFSGQPLLVPDSPYLISPVTIEPSYRAPGITTSQSYLCVFAVPFRQINDGTYDPNSALAKFLHVGTFDGMSIEEDWLDADRVRLSLVFWREKEPSNSPTFNDYLTIGTGHVEPPMPWDPPAESKQKFTKLKWPLFVTDR